ncbi:unnamed protein product [Ophioblennius macclurei]
MARTWTVFTVSSTFCLLLLVLQQTSEVAALCSAAATVTFRENNTENALVTDITVEEGVILQLSPPPDYPADTFTLVGNQLRAQRVLDYEEERTYSVPIKCVGPGETGSISITIVVIMQNINDNPPVYGSSLYNANINEMEPIGFVVGNFPAKDLDSPDLVYTLRTDSEAFSLQSESVPNILVKSRLDFDTNRSYLLVLTAHDKALVEGDPSYTATTTISVTVSDGDNRPPWFLPCNKHVVGPDTICLSDGYTGSVVLNEQQTEPLALEPEPLFAVDGDSGINEAIAYSFLSGNEGGLFAINPTTGNITMLKAADVVGSISLTVRAAQATNSYQFATTTVVITVQVKSLHPPQFESARYEGIIRSAGGMAMNVADTNNPLRIVATDQDYEAAGGINPNVMYTITGSNDFIISNNFLFLTRSIADTTLNLQVTATDTINKESVTSDLVVEVKAGVPPTTRPPPTTTTKTPPVTEDTKTPSTATDGTGLTPSVSQPTNNPSAPTGGTGGNASGGSGGYSVSDMAALGATLGILLLLCLVAIGLLVHRLKKGKAESKKMYEASVFISSLRGDGLKEGVQYTNDAFKHDDDRRDSDPKFPVKTRSVAPPEPVKLSWSQPSREAVLKTAVAPLHDLLPDNASDSGSDKTDSEKEVKPILTKERRVEDGYKSVWFKEDIDPNAKEEVVIIPDSREHDSDDDDDDDDDGGNKKKGSKVLFTDDMDSGLGVKIEDPAGDSDSDVGEQISL